MIQNLLKRCQKHDVETHRTGITNHLPMVLIAMDQLGASEQQLQDFYDSYSQRNIPLRSKSHIILDGWESGLGLESALPDYVDFYREEIDKKGYQYVLNRFLPRLLTGVAASAFHGIIRLGYGVISKNEGEMAFGLAHLSSHYIELGKRPVDTDESGFELLEKARKRFSGVEFTGDRITARMQNASLHPRFAQVNYCPDSLSLKEMSHLLASAYAATNNFTLLHGITSCHAMRVLLPFIDDQVTAFKYYWQAILAAYISAGGAELAPPRDNREPSDSTANFNPIIDSGNAHLIKVVYSCHEEYKYYRNPIFRQIIKNKLSSLSSAKVT